MSRFFCVDLVIFGIGCVDIPVWIRELREFKQHGSRREREREFFFGLSCFVVSLDE